MCFLQWCKYKDIFGIPKKGVHRYRLFGLAIVDVVFTILGAFLFSYLFRFPFWYCLGFLFLSGIVLHRLFCVRTTIDTLLFH
jgi:hypothetical protein